MYAQTIQYIHTMRALMMAAQGLILGCIGIAFLSIVVRIIRKVRKISRGPAWEAFRSGRHLVIDAVCYETTDPQPTLEEEVCRLVDPREA